MEKKRVVRRAASLKTNELKKEVKKVQVLSAAGLLKKHWPKDKVNLDAFEKKLASCDPKLVLKALEALKDGKRPSTAVIKEKIKNL